MGETLAETRVEVDSQRAELDRTVEQLRDALDLRRRFRQNPALFVGLAAGAVFLATGGPMRVARLLRRRVRPSREERAYDSLPKPLQRFVDDVAGTVGPRAEEARQSLSRELLLWRHDPRKHAKISKKLAAELAEGPPGPGRAGWKAFEAAAVLLSAALARKAVERLLSSEPAPEPPVASPPPAPAPVPAARNGAAGQRTDAAEGYSGLSARSTEV